MRAVTRPLSEFLDGEMELDDFAGNDGLLFVRDGVGCAGQGMADRIKSGDAAEFLSSIVHDSTID